MIGHFIFDADALCGFAAHIANETMKGMGQTLEEEHWPLVAAAVDGWLDAQLERMAFAAETTADLNALPVTEAS